MAVFDSRIFAAGRLVQPLPGGWQKHADALNTLFMLPVSRPIAWVSDYLPVNAALRAVIGMIADPALTGPLLTGLGLVPLWKIARRLWPDDADVRLVCILLYVSSGQILFAGMTAYAMTAHLTLNLFWLWLFFMGKPKADIGALCVGFLATGLHQPLFHPLFAAPFLLLLPYKRSWHRCGLYLGGYALICIFWLAWPTYIHSLVLGSGSSAATGAGTDYLTRLTSALAMPNPTRWTDMASNLIRFAAWQSPLLLPLMGAALVLARRQALTVVLSLSVGLPIIVMLIILPSQGHGFGYRYLHPALGAAILLAAQGYHQLAQREPRLWAVVVRTSLLSLALMLPLQASIARSLYGSFAAVSARIQESRADFVIIGTGDALFANDLVINKPDLSNRPLRLLDVNIDRDLIGSLCRRHATIALPTDRFFRPISGYFNIPTPGSADRRIRFLSPAILSAGCRVVPLNAG